MAWRPQYEGVEIVLAPFKQVRLRVFQGGQELSFLLKPDQARHLGERLMDLAAKQGAS